MAADDPALASARAAADRLIKFRPRSEHELRARLRQKGFDQPAIDATVQALARRDLLNDRKFSQYYAAGRLLSRPVGLRALRDELRRKGISAETAAEAVTKAAVGYDELEVARALALRRRAQWHDLPREAVQRRLAGLLQRRGFSGDIVYKVLRDVL
ncbi:MAG: hypothetical protein A3C53_08040 [Omnitrophica WOR_2 bacterium RIFCSPHIGHO2_02_FULL_68_15]|nr:MAG: hypothetical protein A3C53_08040 [Omnitrophica WOR_2 bacterium RIFCSPHIGHO2_02_FULL_68_15]